MRRQDERQIGARGEGETDEQTGQSVSEVTLAQTGQDHDGGWEDETEGEDFHTCDSSRDRAAFVAKIRPVGGQMV